MIICFYIIMLYIHCYSPLLGGCYDYDNTIVHKCPYMLGYA